MTPEDRDRLNVLVGGKADGLVQHAMAFLDFWKELEREDQKTAVGELMVRFKRPEFRNEAVIDGEGLSRERLEELSAKVGMMIDATLNYIISNRMEPERAADEVQRLLEGRDEMDERVFCLAGILSSHVVPYAKVPESRMRMTNEQYQEHLKILSDGVSKIRIASGISKNAAEMADLVLSVLEEEMEWEKKVTLLAYFIVLRERTVEAGQMQQQNGEKKRRH
ncbi:MAG: hypothetical protein MI742_16310 [Desulfobacterales bacterium]|nr:hypothetical protein [Desulfobacterales bacterium]